MRPWSRGNFEAGGLAGASPETGELLATIPVPPSFLGLDWDGMMELQGRWDASRARTRTLLERLGGSLDWRFDSAQSAVEVVQADTVQAVPAQFIGSHHDEEHSWCWSWANPGEAGQPHTYAAVESNCRSLAGPGRIAWEEPMFPSDPLFSELLAHSIADRMDAPVLARRWPERHLTVYYLVDGSSLRGPPA